MTTPCEPRTINQIAATQQVLIFVPAEATFMLNHHVVGWAVPTTTWRLTPILATFLAIALVSPASAQRRGAGGEGAGVYKSRISPHWFDGGSKFWYQNNLAGGAREYVLVDAQAATRQPAFDHEKLAAALSQAGVADVRTDRLSLDALEFKPTDHAIEFRAGDKNWRCDLKTYSLTELPEQPPPSGNSSSPPAPQRGGGGNGNVPQRGFGGGRGGSGGSAKSPDGKWTATIKENNVVVRAADADMDIQLTTDGREGLGYGMLNWSPDSQTLVAFRIEPQERQEVHLIESSPRGGGRAKLQSRPYALPGDKFTAHELHLFDITAQKEIACPVDRIDFGFPRLRWSEDGRSFTYQQVDRGHQRLRLIEIDARTGASRNLIDEKSETFIWTAHTENVGIPAVTWLQKSDELIYCSERDGWRHLYLVDAKEGAIKNQITQGEFVVRGIERIDEENRQIWFRACGRNPDQDPYLIHYYRVNFDGTGLVALTAGNGTHTVQFSPDNKYVIDSYSRIDQPPIHELRRTDDGQLVCKLEEAEISELKSGGWEAPEVFTAKGRDGKTDIWGIICRPRDFGAAKKYPVIEQIYAGPQGSFVPKSFSSQRRFSSLTDLGFVVVQIDGMGTANRSKAFHDVCWHNLKDAGLPDRILWHKTVAAKYPWYDISRVGIYGGSAGGQNSTAALLFYPEFYKVGVSGCGCHDNRMDKASWNEQWMGYPIGPQYGESSNIDNAARLRGKLLLIVGELDTNVPPESTFRLADALIKANKDFDLVVVPGAGHGMGGAYGTRRMNDFFVRHLLGVEPPNRNQ